jgi:hypothetical protein
MEIGDWNRVFKIVKNYKHLGQYRIDILNGAKSVEKRKLNNLSEFILLDDNDPIKKGIIAIKKRYQKRIKEQNRYINLY